MRIEARASSIGEHGPVFRIWVVTYINWAYMEQSGSLIFSAKESADVTAASLRELDDFDARVSCHEVEIRG
jgi:hypothetical protein